jgi:hypothetical protein
MPFCSYISGPARQSTLEEIEIGYIVHAGQGTVRSTPSVICRSNRLCILETLQMATA